MKRRIFPVDRVMRFSWHCCTIRAFFAQGIMSAIDYAQGGSSWQLRGFWTQGGMIFIRLLDVCTCSKRSKSNVRLRSGVFSPLKLFYLQWQSSFYRGKVCETIQRPPRGNDRVNQYIFSDITICTINKVFISQFNDSNFVGWTAQRLQNMYTKYQKSSWDLVRVI